MSQVNVLAENDTFEFDALREAHHYRRGLLREFGPFLGPRVLEIGAGIGQFTELLAGHPTVKTVLAIEPEARFCTEFRRRLPALTVLQGTLQTASPPPAPPWDNIVSVNVLEHIEKDLQELRDYHRLLQPGCGRLCLFVPARPEVSAPIDKDFGHLRRYRRPELRQKLEQAGFRVQCLHYFNLIGYAGWWWTFCVLKRRRFSLGAVRLFDRVIFPIASRFEQQVVRPPIGQSLIAIAEAG
ncbi:MAG TPA: methyltransferase domain-containing protein [Candidatus Saccharimonadales bacterium]|nr:methyltransferase domain-containing protein [Candidatus Saccharimonadales bacterium]